MTKFNKFLTLMFVVLFGLSFQINSAQASATASCTSATLHGYISPNPSYTSTVWFEWSTNSSTVSNGGGTQTGTQSFSVDSYFEKTLTNLSGNTTYYFRTVARNSQGTAYGEVLSFKTLSCGGGGDTTNLSATTNAATNITQSSARLEGYINTDGTTSRWFEYGTNSGNLSQTTNRSSIYNSSSVSQTVSGLSSNRTYYFRLVAERDGNTVYGEVRSFSTNQGYTEEDNEPNVTTNSATDIERNSATLRGYVNTNGSSNVTRWFEYGTNSSNLSRSTSRNSISSSGNISGYVSGLSSDTTYYFRAVAENNAGTVYGSIKSFRTTDSGTIDDEDDYLSVSTRSATNIYSGSATLNGYVSTNSSNNTSRWFEWGRSSGNLDRTTSKSSIGYSGDASAYISGLNSNTTYYFRIVARGDSGTEYGEVRSFTTNGGSDNNDDGDAPSATTRSATSVGSNSATVNGYVDANGGDNTYAWFEWGTSSGNLTSATTKRYQGSSDSSIQAALTGLSANTTYYYRAVGQNSNGTDRGSVLSFTTSNGGGNQTNNAPTAITMVATNITGSAATLNSLVLQANGEASNAWFEWGTSQSLGRRTSETNVGKAASARHNTQITGLTPGATYYFRVVAENESGRSYGIIRSFVATKTAVIVTPIKKPVTPVKVVQPVKTVTVVEHAEGVSSLVMLTITGEDDKVVRGETETYTVTWRNQSNQDLRNVVLRVIIPESLSFESADDGTYSKIENTHTLLIGDLMSGEEGQMTIALKGVSTLKADNLVVTTANLVYTDEYDIQGDALAYVTQKVSMSGSVLGAGVGFAGISFAIIGWLILIILIVILLILINYLYRKMTCNKDEQK